jgi:hypothetical protein
MLKSNSRFAAAGTAIAVATSATAVLLLGGGSATAAEPTPPARQAAAAPAANSILGYMVKDGTLFAADMNPDLVKWFTAAPYNNTVTGATVKDGSLGIADLSQAARDALKGAKGDPATDAFGKQGGSLTIVPKAIVTIGGGWVAGKTELSSFILPAGTWLINSAVTFDRKDATDPGYLAPTTDTMPQFALRFNATETNQFGDDAGTIMGNPISRAGYTELTGSSTKTIILDKTTTITAYGFGYNEDRSAFGGGQITAGGQVTAVKIG